MRVLNTPPDTLAEVGAQAQNYATADEAREAAKAARDDAIRRASAEGQTRRAVALAAGMDAARVQQIVNEKPTTPVPRKECPQYNDQAARSIAAVQSLSRAAPPVVNAEVIGELPVPAWFGAHAARKWDAAVARYRFLQTCMGEAANPNLDPAARVTAMADASRTARHLAVDAEGLVTTLSHSHGPQPPSSE